MISLTSIISCGTQYPRTLFLMDGIGAGISAFILGVLWGRFPSLLGFPQTTLYVLALIPCFFMLYDGLQYFKKSNPSAVAVKSIAYMNGAYCIFSLLCCLFYYDTLTTLGFLYLFMEIVLVITIAYVEWCIGEKRARASSPTSSVETKS